MPAEISFRLPLFSAGIIMIRRRRSRKTVMMYPYITLADGTEIIHSHIIEKEDGRHIPHDCQFFPEPEKQRLLPGTAG